LFAGLETLKNLIDMKKKNIANICSLILVVLLFLFSSSCKKDDIAEESNNVTDIDGNVYQTVVIGTQVWMAENLRVTRYRNGDIIGTTTPAILDISGEASPKYQWAHDGDETNVATYGRLYTWYAVNDIRNICPIGWHIPTEEDINTLRDYLITNGYNYDGTTSGNGFAKALTSKSNWIFSTEKGAVGNTDYPGKRNVTGFNGLPGGVRSAVGIFSDLNTWGAIWGASRDSTTALNMNCYYANRDLAFSFFPKKTGTSVRCLRD
jgi:uncharacterized protein (TIGR02145 family)